MGVDGHGLKDRMYAASCGCSADSPFDPGRKGPMPAQLVQKPYMPCKRQRLEVEYSKDDRCRPPGQDLRENWWHGCSARPMIRRDQDANKRLKIYASTKRYWRSSCEHIIQHQVPELMQHYLLWRKRKVDLILRRRVVDDHLHVSRSCMVLSRLSRWFQGRGKYERCSSQMTSDC